MLDVWEMGPIDMIEILGNNDLPLIMLIGYNIRFLIKWTYINMINIPY